MKLCCNKCKNILTKDMYYVPRPKGPPFTNKTWFRVWEGSMSEGYYIKDGLFYIKPYEKKYSWTYKDSSCVDSKKEYLESYGDDGHQHYHSVLGGSPETIICGEGNVLEGIIPPFKEGHGCCNWSNGASLLCKCGNKVGKMYLDCYEEGIVKFLTSNTDRVYK